MARGGTLACAVVAADRTGESAVVLAALEALGAREALTKAEKAGAIQLDAEAVRALDEDAVEQALVGLAAAEQRRVHRALADALDGQTAPSRIVLRAAHLVKSAAGPDEHAAAAAEQAAVAADALGELIVCGDWWERAARLSPDESDRFRRLSMAGDRLWLGAAVDRARVLLTEAFESTDDPVRRAEAAVILGQAVMWEQGARRALDILLPTADAVEELNPDLAALLLVHAVNTTVVSCDMHAGMTFARRAVDLAAKGTGEIVPAAQVAMGFALTLHGDHVAAAEILAPIRTLALGVLEMDLPELDHLANVMGMIDVVTEQWSSGEAFLDRVMSRARDEKAISMLGMTSGILAELKFRTGRWTEAWRLATGPLAEGAVMGVERAWADAFRAHLAAAMGHADECRSLAERALAEADALDAPIAAMWAHASLGLLELSQGHPSTAAMHYDRISVFSDAMDQRQPGVLWWHSDHIESLARAGRRHEAEKALQRFEREHDADNAPMAAASVARCRGLLADEHAAAEAAFAASLEIHKTISVPFELARVLLSRAERRQVAGDAAAASADLDEARAIFDALGAPFWRAQADELRARWSEDAVPAGFEGLTAAEQRVAAAVGRGLTNREVATELFISVKTVDFHLQKIYRKLGVRSRTELALKVGSTT